MSFSANNFASGIQPHLGSYLHGSSHFQKNYASQQTPTYPLLHPAAVAAMAAAAAGYSQFGSRLTNGPLNLTSVPSYRGTYNFNEPDENRSSSYNYNLSALQNNSNAASYASTYTNGFSGSKFQFPHGASAFQVPQSDSSHSYMHSALAQPTNDQGCSSRLGTPPVQRTHKSQHGQKTTYKAKIKKAINAQEAANRKRQEFDELVKARTDTLLSGYTPPKSETLSSTTVSTGHAVTNLSAAKQSPDSPNYKKVIEAVLDAKKSALLRSPSVVAYLERQQRSLAEFKRRTEVFCVENK